ncbi:regulatory protein RecX [Bifidobacterium simiiventris]|uniref:regulatory protein RecX n=1 Tax=Bifidobacterium simiiventris TaxID=2834434 RepID=UPI0030843ED5
MIDAGAFLAAHAPAVMPDSFGRQDPVESSESGMTAGGRRGRRLRRPEQYGRSDTARSRFGAAGARQVDDPHDVDACREAALCLLDAAPRSSGAMRERLAGKGYASDTVEAVVERLEQVHLIDDEAYAESMVRYCVARLMGARGTMAELSRKGVPRPIAARAVDEARERGVFEDAAWELARRYAAKTEGLDLDKRRQRFWSAGGRKGHDPQDLSRIAYELFH